MRTGTSTKRGSTSGTTPSATRMGQYRRSPSRPRHPPHHAFDGSSSSCRAARRNPLGPPTKKSRTQFKSAALLLTSIRRQRESRSPNVDVTAVYPGLVVDESKARDRLRAGSAAVSLAKAAVEELSAIQGATDQRVRAFYGRLTAAVVSNGTDVNEVREVLRGRHATLHERLSAGATRAEAARRKLATLKTSQADESSRRQDVQERVAELDREVQRCAERAKSWTAQIKRVLPEAHDVESTLTTESASVEKAIVGLGATLEQMQATRKKNSKAVQVLGVRKRELTQRRPVLVAALNAVNGLLSPFRQKLRALGISNDGDVDNLERVIREETQHSDAIGALAGRSLVVLGALRAREQRRRLDEARQRLYALNAEIRNWEEQVGRIKGAAATCVAIESLLKQERQGSIERHIGAYGPMITMIQQRLRAVYGFGGVQLEARGGEANPDYARGADFGGDTGATVWYKRSVHNVLATTETPA